MVTARARPASRTPLLPRPPPRHARRHDGVTGAAPPAAPRQDPHRACGASRRGHVELARREFRAWESTRQGEMHRHAVAGGHTPPLQGATGSLCGRYDARPGGRVRGLSSSLRASQQLPCFVRQLQSLSPPPPKQKAISSRLQATVPVAKGRPLRVSHGSVHSSNHRVGAVRRGAGRPPRTRPRALAARGAPARGLSRAGGGRGRAARQQAGRAAADKCLCP